jgi:hypothetical protein
MSRYVREAEPLCKDCKAFVAAEKREMRQFPDGKFYLVTGRCGSNESQLKDKDVAGAFTASTNAVHHRVATLAARLTCFVEKA